MRRLYDRYRAWRVRKIWAEYEQLQGDVEFYRSCTALGFSGDDAHQALVTRIALRRWGITR